MTAELSRYDIDIDSGCILNRDTRAVLADKIAWCPTFRYWTARLAGLCEGDDVGGSTLIELGERTLARHRDPLDQPSTDFADRLCVECDTKIEIGIKCATCVSAVSA